MRSTRVLAAALAITAATGLAACASTGTTAGASGGTNAVPATATTATLIPGSMDVAKAPFIGSRKTKHYYPTSCQTTQLIKSADKVGFASMKDAEAAGFKKDLYSTDCRY